MPELSEHQVQALCIIAFGIAALICAGVARWHRLQDAKRAGINRVLDAHAREQLRKLT